MKIAFLIAATSAFCVTGQAAQTAQHLKFLGTRSLSGHAAQAATLNLGLEVQQTPDQDAGFIKSVTGRVSPARVPADHVPAPPGSSVSSATGLNSFPGLTHMDQRLADGGNQFSSEPPDQCLAVGNGFVLEGVNSAFRVRSTSGTNLTPAVAVNAFYGLPPTILRTTPPVFGPFTSDQRCYYDAPTQRWFITALVIAADPVTGDFAPFSGVLIAVSTSSDPTQNYNIFLIDATDDTGTPDHAGCPCFGDQPLIGADANGFYITTNEFPIVGAGFNGAQIFAMSKAQLIAGISGTVVHISNISLAESMAYSVQPAIVPPGGAFATVNNGTEYFLSALDFTSTLDNRIAVWAITNTASLSDPTPSIALQSAVLASEVYGFPPAAQQQDGPLPLADAIKAGLLGKAGAQHLELIQSNDDRMQQTVFANGLLWSSLATAMKPANGPVRAGAAWFAVAPTWSNGTLGGSVSNQGYVGVNGESILFPAVGVNNSGKAVMGFTLVSPTRFPSAAFTVLGSTASDIKVVAAGTEPDDGFTGYPISYPAKTGTNAARWGDYSTAVADENGAIWFATEFIPGGPRTVLANWGTYIAQVGP